VLNVLLKSKKSLSGYKESFSFVLFVLKGASVEWLLRSIAVGVIILLSLFVVIPHSAYSEELEIKSSTQFLWGEDMLSDGQAIFSQYLLLSYRPEGENYYISGYGRVWDNLSGSSVRDSDLSGRLYYLYLNYNHSETVSFRLGRQFVNFTAGSSILDGITFNVRDIGPVGISFSGGTDVKYSLDSDHSREGDYFIGINVFFEKIESTQLGVSYVRKYQGSELAREEFGLNARYFYSYLSPYTEVRYDRLSETVDEAVIGLDLFPVDFLMIKTEFYHSYPTFDSTSIYSVFASDKYSEYLLRAEYSFEETSLVLYASYIKQDYEDSDSADVYSLGARYYPKDSFLIKASVDLRKGYGGKLWGVEVSGDYTINEELILSGGAQIDAYRRPVYSDTDDAQRYWAGCQWHFRPNTSLDARIEGNVNENFSHNILGRIALNWQL
jgi:hypothetical protein